MIREAKPEDGPAIQALYKVLIPNGPVHVLADRIEQIAKEPYNFLFVYEEDPPGGGTILGTVFFTVCLSPMFGFQSFGVIENFVVAETARGRGIGTALLNHVLQTGRAHRCFAVKLLSGSSREDAHRFFTRNGFNGADKKGFIKYLNRS